MKARFLLSILAPVLALLPSLPAAGADFLVFKVKAMLPVRSVEVGTATDKLLKRTLNTKELVNLALGRPIGTRLNPRTEVLAVAATFEPPSNAPLARLIVCNPRLQGTAQIVTVIATLSELDYSVAFRQRDSKGQGIVTALIQPTTLGNPLLNQLTAATLRVGGTVSGKHVPGNQLQRIAPLGSARCNGRIQFRFTNSSGTTDFDGFVTNGVFTVSGSRPISMFTE